MNFYFHDSDSLRAGIKDIMMSGGDDVNVTLASGPYTLPDWPLPTADRANRRTISIDGRGATIYFPLLSKGFHASPRNQKEALNFSTNTSYRIENFSRIVGGAYGVRLGGTFNSVIRNCEFIGQSHAAIELRFALMSRVENVLVTNPRRYGIRVLDGDWSGASKVNSQSNHTVLSQCRVYVSGSVEGEYSFDIRNSNGVRLLDCISEGWANKRAVNFEAKGSPTVKHFMVQNFHLEHAPTEAGIYISADASTSNIVDQLYISNPNVRYPIRFGHNGPAQLKNIGWWTDKMKIHCQARAPRVIVDQCHYRLKLATFVTDDKRGIFPHNIQFVNPLPA